MSQNEEESSLLKKTRQMLDEYGGTYFDIYDRTGIQPTYVSAVATGRVKNPSVNKVQRLYEFLSGKQLAL